MKIITRRNEREKNNPPKLFYINGILHQHHSGCARLFFLLSNAAFYFKVCGEQNPASYFGHHRSEHQLFIVVLDFSGFLIFFYYNRGLFLKCFNHLERRTCFQVHRPSRLRRLIFLMILYAVCSSTTIELAKLFQSLHRMNSLCCEIICLLECLNLAQRSSGRSQSYSDTADPTHDLLGYS